MMKNYSILLAMVLVFCTTSRAQNTTSYGGIIEPGTTSGTAIGGSNTFFGAQAGEDTTPGFGADGRNNTFIGYQSGLENYFGHSNTFMGYRSGGNNINGVSNIYIGAYSGYDNENGDGNVFLGNSTGFNVQGSNNVFLGTSAGHQSENGSYNVFLGYRAGYNEMGSNLLYIDNSDTDLPLIWGDFTNDALRFHGSVRITDIPQNNALNRILVSDVSGNVNWRDAASLGDGTGTDDQQLSLVGNDLQLEDGGNVDLSSYLDNTERTDEEIRDVVGAMVSGNTETRISVTYNDAANKFNFVVEDNLSQYVNDAGFITSPNDADADPNNELQTLSYDAGTQTLSISGGNNADLSSLAGTHDFPSYPASAGDGGGDTTNSFFGYFSGANATGNNNTFVGNQSGLNNTGNDNSSLGSRTLENNTTGERNTANGVYTLFSNTMGIENTAVGYAALGFNATGNGNTATGFQSLWVSNGNFNTADGYLALSGNTSGSNNTAMGHNALTANTTGSDNVAIGSGSGTTSGDLDTTVAIGSSASVGADQAIAIGSGASATGLNSVAIGDGAVINADNEMVLGNLSTTHIRANVMGFTPISDARFKTNVKENIPGLEFITKLRPVSYTLERTKLHQFLTGKEAPNTIKNELSMGFIAQEVEQTTEENGYIFTGIKKPANKKDHYGLRYIEFVVPLTKAVQELSALVENQQQAMEAQQQEIEMLKAMVYGSETTNSSTTATGLKQETTLSKGFALAQNTPNPFNTTTMISATVPETVRQAKITIYNLNGLELAGYDINQRGKTSVAISGGTLPSGMYIYALIADDQVIDTKKMILTR